MIEVLMGLNTFILGAVIYNTLRVGKLEGRLMNGDFLRCPFYRKGCGSGKGDKGKS